ncbi:DUF1918 domain-containing protein [Streptomyces antimycoticus]|uniref:DUF1918 domain-containing protein n=1 Tax=Streptomyces antimycoticus TaxID=68175 RepID=UPI0036EC219F
MRAQVGDQLIVESPHTGATKRDGEIVGLHHDDGTPPYDVRWSDTDQITLVFPVRTHTFTPSGTGRKGNGRRPAPTGPQ